MLNKVERTQMWVAAILTCGEWAIALFFLFHKGELILLYMAITGILRETEGGRHHHHILGAAIRKLNPRMFSDSNLA